MSTLPSIVEQFDLPRGDLIAWEPISLGLINTTMLGTISATSGETTRYIFQMINRQVFPDVDHLMENIERVTSHLATAYGESTQQALQLINTSAGSTFHRTAEGDCWRAFQFVDNSITHTAIKSPEQARQAAAAFGEFSMLLTEFPSPPLHEILPDFHNTAKRHADFLTAVETDSANRAAAAEAEISAALETSHWANIITDAQANGTVPLRIAHNDSKIENILFDATTNQAKCVIDLDTTMPGSLLHDFGDLVRTAAATSHEDETDQSKIGLSLPIFKALAEGFLSTCGEIMTPTERQLLPVAGKVIVYEQALRFLTDYLNRDTYYRVTHARHNLERARNQLRLANVLDQLEPELERLVMEK